MSFYYTYAYAKNKLSHIVNSKIVFRNQSTST